MLNGVDTDRLARPAPEAARPSGRVGWCPRRRRTSPSTPPRWPGVPIVLAGPVLDPAVLRRRDRPAAGPARRGTPATSTTGPWPGCWARPASRSSPRTGTSPTAWSPARRWPAAPRSPPWPAARCPRSSTTPWARWPRRATWPASPTRSGAPGALPRRRPRARGPPVLRGADGGRLRAHLPARPGPAGGRVIGWYVHHHGHGHLHRALTVAARLAERGEEVTVLSSLPRPAGWSGAWVHLARDDAGPARRPDRRRPAALGAGRGPRAALPVGAPCRPGWPTRRPRLVVVDVSVEVALLARLHGVPVVSMALPGRRGDAAHLLGLGVCDLLVAAWPASATRDAARRPRAAAGAAATRSAGCPASRCASPHRGGRAPAGRRRVVVLMGTGGHDLDRARLAVRPGADTGLGVDRAGREPRRPGPTTRPRWSPTPTSCSPTPVRTRSPRWPPPVGPPWWCPSSARTTSRRHRCACCAAAPGPRSSSTGCPRDGWAGAPGRAARLDGRAWAGWCDGGAASRFADLLVAHGGSA